MSSLKVRHLLPIILTIRNNITDKSVILPKKNIKPSLIWSSLYELSIRCPEYLKFNQKTRINIINIVKNNNKWFLPNRSVDSLHRSESFIVIHIFYDENMLARKSYQGMQWWQKIFRRKTIFNCWLSYGS